MSTRRDPRPRCYTSARRGGQARRHRELTVEHGNDLRSLPPLIRVSRCHCGKLTYFAYRDAELALAGVDHSNPRRRECRIYACPIRGGWHLTSQERRSPAHEHKARN
ncbi:hypothetical protein [Nocardia vaccinii]|uniref:hypothetical protein n=1 Tax=Nocardia vaccinii TaxID=1822 RepID=UPI000A61581A|nr:hypothetical protein [Nocardia vaccinii]